MTSLADRPRNSSTAGITDASVLRAYQRCEWYELALMRHGWTVERFQKTARKITGDYVALNIPYLTQDKRDALADFVVEKSLPAVIGFKADHPTESYSRNGGKHFDSWICDIMFKRCVDHFRSKSEGWGDRRYGNDNRVELSEDPDPADGTEFDSLVDDRRRIRWNYQAKLDGYEDDFSGWMCKQLDRGLGPEALAVEIPKKPLRQGRPEIETAWPGAVGL